MTDVDNFNNQSLGEEIANAITHGIGAIASIVGLVFLILQAVINGNIYSIVSGAIFGASLIILYSMSTLYHAITNIKAKKVLRTFDHCSIFFLISGTYAPFCLVTLNGKIGWSLFAFNLAITIIGTVLNSINIKKFHKLSLLLYLLMGWSIVFAIRPIVHVLNPVGLWLLVTGGIFYTLGIIFYIATKHKYMHTIWHFFVLAGSITHYLCVLLYVIPTH
jgi:channel protein, hemolysin III family